MSITWCVIHNVLHCVYTSLRQYVKSHCVNYVCFRILVTHKKDITFTRRRLRTETSCVTCTPFTRDRREGKSPTANNSSHSSHSVYQKHLSNSYLCDIFYVLYNVDFLYRKKNRSHLPLFSSSVMTSTRLSLPLGYQIVISTVSLHSKISKR